MAYEDFRRTKLLEDQTGDTNIPTVPIQGFTTAVSPNVMSGTGTTMGNVAQQQAQPTGDFVQASDPEILNDIARQSREDADANAAANAQEQRHPDRGGIGGVFMEALDTVRDYPDNLSAAWDNFTSNWASPFAAGMLPLTAASIIEAPLSIPIGLVKETVGDIVYTALTGDPMAILENPTIPPMFKAVITPVLTTLGLVAPSGFGQSVISAYEGGKSGRNSGLGAWEAMIGKTDGLPQPVRSALRVLIEVVMDPLTWVGVGAFLRARKVGELGRITRTAEEYDALSLGKKIRAQLADVPQEPLQGLDLGVRSLGVVSDQMFALPIRGAQQAARLPFIRSLGEEAQRARRGRELGQDADVVADYAGRIEPFTNQADTPTTIDDRGVIRENQDLGAGAFYGSVDLNQVTSLDPRRPNQPVTEPLGDIIPNVDTTLTVMPEAGVKMRWDFATKDGSEVYARIQERMNGRVEVILPGREVTMRVRSVPDAFNLIASAYDSANPLPAPNAKPSTLTERYMSTRLKRSAAPGAFPNEGTIPRDLSAREIQPGLFQYEHRNRGTAYVHALPDGTFEAYDGSGLPISERKPTTFNDAYTIVREHLASQEYAFTRGPNGETLHPNFGPSPSGGRIVDEMYRRSTAPGVTDPRLKTFWDEYRSANDKYGAIIDQEQVRIDDVNNGVIKEDMLPDDARILDPSYSRQGNLTVDTPRKAMAQALMAIETRGISMRAGGPDLARAWPPNSLNLLSEWQANGHVLRRDRLPTWDPAIAKKRGLDGGELVNVDASVIRSWVNNADLIREAMVTDDEDIYNTVVGWLYRSKKNGVLIRDDEVADLLLPGATLIKTKRKNSDMTHVADIIEANHKVKSGVENPVFALPEQAGGDLTMVNYQRPRFERYIGVGREDFQPKQGALDRYQPPTDPTPNQGPPYAAPDPGTSRPISQPDYNPNQISRMADRSGFDNGPFYQNDPEGLKNTGSSQTGNDMGGNQPDLSSTQPEPDGPDPQLPIDPDTFLGYDEGVPFYPIYEAIESLNYHQEFPAVRGGERLLKSVLRKFKSLEDLHTKFMAGESDYQDELGNILDEEIGLLQKRFGKEVGDLIDPSEDPLDIAKTASSLARSAEQGDYRTALNKVASTARKLAKYDEDFEKNIATKYQEKFDEAMENLYELIDLYGNDVPYALKNEWMNSELAIAANNTDRTVADFKRAQLGIREGSARQKAAENSLRADAENARAQEVADVRAREAGPVQGVEHGKGPRYYGDDTNSTEWTGDVTDPLNPDLPPGPTGFYAREGDESLMSVGDMYKVGLLDLSDPKNLQILNEYNTYTQDDFSLLGKDPIGRLIDLHADMRRARSDASRARIQGQIDVLTDDISTVLENIQSTYDETALGYKAHEMEAKLRAANNNPPIPWQDNITQDAQDGYTRLYRVEAKPGGDQTMPQWVKDGLIKNGQDEAAGRWFTDDPAIAQWYASNEYPDNGRVVYIDVPTNEVEQYRVSNLKGDVGETRPQRFSLDPENEFFLPRELAATKQEYNGSEQFSFDPQAGGKIPSKVERRTSRAREEAAAAARAEPPREVSGGFLDPDDPGLGRKLGAMQADAGRVPIIGPEARATIEDALAKFVEWNKVRHTGAADVRARARNRIVDALNNVNDVIRRVRESGEFVPESMREPADPLAGLENPLDSAPNVLDDAGQPVPAEKPAKAAKPAKAKKAAKLAPSEADAPAVTDAFDILSKVRARIRYLPNGSQERLAGQEVVDAAEGFIRGVRESGESSGSDSEKFAALSQKFDEWESSRQQKASEPRPARERTAKARGVEARAIDEEDHNIAEGIIEELQGLIDSGRFDGEEKYLARAERIINQAKTITRANIGQTDLQGLPDEIVRYKSELLRDIERRKPVYPEPEPNAQRHRRGMPPREMEDAIASRTKSNEGDLKAIKRSENEIRALNEEIAAAQEEIRVDAGNRQQAKRLTRAQNKKKMLTENIAERRRMIEVREREKTYIRSQRDLYDRNEDGWQNWQEDLKNLDENGQPITQNPDLATTDSIPGGLPYWPEPTQRMERGPTSAPEDLYTRSRIVFDDTQVPARELRGIETGVRRGRDRLGRQNEDIWNEVISAQDDDTKTAAFNSLVRRLTGDDSLRPYDTSEKATRDLGVTIDPSTTGGTVHVLPSESSDTGMPIGIYLRDDRIVVYAPESSAGDPSNIANMIVARAGETIPVHVVQAMPGMGDGLFGVSAPGSSYSFGDGDYDIWDPVDRLYQMGQIDERARRVLNYMIPLGKKKSKKGAKGIPQTEVRLADYYMIKRRDMDSLQGAMEEVIKAYHAHHGYDPNVPRSLFFRILAKYDGITHNIRERLMMNPYTGGVMTTLDHVGDTALMLARGEFRAAKMSWTTGFRTQYKTQDERMLGLLEAAYRSIRDNDPHWIYGTEAGEMYQRLGMDITSDLSINVSRDGIPRNRKMFMDSQIERLYPDSEKTQRRIKRILAATGFRGSDFILEMRSGGDLARRFAIASDHIMENVLPKERTDFGELVHQFGSGPDHQPEEFLQALGPMFSPDDVRLMGREFGFTKGESESLARNWKNRFSRMNDAGVKRAKDVLFSYDQTNADDIVRRVFVFHYWYTRASVVYPRLIVKNPYLMLNYVRMMEGLDNEAEGQPSSVRGMIRAFSGPEGYLIMMDPMKALSTAATFRREAIDSDQETAFDKFLNQSGLFLNPMLHAAASVIGATANENVDPLATFQIRRIFGSGINMINAALGGSYPGTPFQDLLGEGTENLAAAIGVDNRYRRSDGNTRVLMKNGIMDKVMEKYGIESGTELALWPAEAVDELDRELNAFDDGRNTAIVDSAYRDWATANLERTALGLTLPVGATLRSETRDERLNNARGVGTTPYDIERGIPEAAAGASSLYLRNAQYNSLLPAGELGRVQRSPYTGESRDDVLNRPGMEIMRTFTEWKSRARSVGVAEFRQAMMDRSPSYREYIDGLIASGIDEDPGMFDSMSVGYQAFLASLGKRRREYDPNQLPAGSAGPADAIFAQQNRYESDSSSQTPSMMFKNLRV